MKIHYTGSSGVRNNSMLFRQMLQASLCAAKQGNQRVLDTCVHFFLQSCPPYFEYFAQRLKTEDRVLMLDVISSNWKLLFNFLGFLCRRGANDLAVGGSGAVAAELLTRASVGLSRQSPQFNAIELAFTLGHMGNFSAWGVVARINISREEPGEQFNFVHKLFKLNPEYAAKYIEALRQSHCLVAGDMLMHAFIGFVHLKSRLSNENDFLSYFKQVLADYFNQANDFTLFDKYLENHPWAGEDIGHVLDIYLMSGTRPYLHLFNAMLSIMGSLPLSTVKRLNQLIQLPDRFRQE